MTSSKTSGNDSNSPSGLPPAKAAPDEPRFWRQKTLAQMTREEWESLCDGCAKCCLVKLAYEDTGEVDHTNLACRLLDTHSCRCTDYPNRQKRVPDCLTLTPRRVRRLSWLPATC